MTAASDWCPTCADHVVPNSAGRCSWCETEVGAKPAKKGKPLGKHLSAITPEMLDLARQLYDRGMSMRQVAEAILDHTDYANVHAAQASLFKAFRLRGWKRRERIAAVGARCTTHGRARRSARGTEDHLAYRRERRAELAAAARPECIDEGCARRAMIDRPHCHFHDPETRAKRVAGIAAGRAKQRAGMHRWGDVGQPILDWARQQRYPAMRLSERSGVQDRVVRSVLDRGPDELITDALLQKLLHGITTNPTAEAATTESAAS